MFISIIVGFKNREILRVEKALISLSKQNFTDFELIFIDYGSDIEIAAQAKIEVEQYSFSKYFYSNTKGWLWNRAHALNLGLKKATGKIVLFYDIDLIIEKDFLHKIACLDYSRHFYTFSCFYLPENFDLSRNLEKDGIHHEQNYVGLCAVMRNTVENINGFDEFFMVWGVEDDDLYIRLSDNGLARRLMPVSEFKVFHQWHQSHAPSKPTLWYLMMVEHLYNKPIVDIVSHWGIISERPLLKIRQGNEYLFKKLTIWEDKSMLFFNPFIQQFHAMKEGEIGSIEFVFKIEIKQNTGIEKLFTRAKHAPTIKNELGRKDIIEFFQYFIGVHRALIQDYYFVADENSLKFQCIKN